MLKVDIVKIDVSAGKAQRARDYVAEEKPLHVFLNRTRYATIFCSPSMLKELAIGHAVSEGIVRTVEDIERIDLKETQSVCRIHLKPNVRIEEKLKLLQHFSRIIFSACGSQEPFQPTLGLEHVHSDLSVKAETILNCVNRLNFIADTYRKTGGVHVAAIYKGDGAIVTFAEDVGRHNSVDKVIGLCFLERTDLSCCFLAMSGRLTSDIVIKAARAGIPIVCSLAATLDSGITVATETKITLVGFVRGKRMNVYTWADRILAKK